MADQLPPTPVQLAERGALLGQDGRFAEAEEVFRAAIAIESDCVEAHVGLGNVLQTRGKLDGAIAWYRRALAAKPDLFLAQANLGVALQAQGKLGEAEISFRSALELKPDSAMVHSFLGKVLHGQGKLEDAIVSYRKALGLQPNTGGVHHNLGNALRGIGRLEEALSHYGRATELDPGFAEAHNNLASLLLEVGMLDEAAVHNRRAFDLRPDLADVHHVLGNILKSQGRFQEAIVSYTRALALQPDLAESHNNLGVLLNAQGKMDEAIASYRRAAALRPDLAAAHNNLGVVLSGLGKLDEAAPSFRRAFELGHQSAAHMVAALKGVTTDHAPRSFIVELFDNYAPEFDTHLVDVLHYGTPHLLRQMVGTQRRFQRAADLGCGTGLAGAAFRDLADHMTGIDLSPRMIELANKKHLYDRLITADIAETLRDDAQSYDLFLVTEVLIYVGRLDELFGAIATRARPGAWFAFSAEIAEHEDWKLLSSGRYAHSRAYLEARLSAIQATVQVWQEQPIRLADGEPCLGHHVVAKFGG